MARDAVEKICANGHIPIVVGGTGFYIQALLYDIDLRTGERMRAAAESWRPLPVSRAQLRFTPGWHRWMRRLRK